MTQINNFINGDYLAPEGNIYVSGINPSNGEPFYEVCASKEKDVMLAVAAAKEAFPAWSRTDAFERAKILQRISELILENRDKLAKLESKDSGKPYRVARELEIPRSAKNFSFFAAACTQLASECHPVFGHSVNYTLRQPLGVVVCISPWNLPLYLLTWKIAPALAAGNCVIAKPASITPLTAHFLTKLCQEAGLPKGALNIIYGSGSDLSETLCTHKDIKAISFTGGTETGAKIAQHVSPLFKKYSLEMGGKNSALIFADCDFDKAVETTVRSGFSNQGQICLCMPRVLIEAPIYEKFKEAFIKKVSSLKIGDPMREDTDMGPLISFDHRNRVREHIKKAQLEGGRILCGGEEIHFSDDHLSKGFFMQPTVMEGIPINAKINQQEVFGPVVTLIPFSSEEEAVHASNSTSFGLAATLWTQDIKRAHRLAEKIEVGIFWVNTWMLRDLRTPFGGMKSSGVGREGGLEAMRFFTEPKNVCIDYSS